MGLLYWSNTLIEHEVKELRLEVEQLQGELVMAQLVPQRVTERARPHVNANLPNLLTADPFYAQTLPELLGPTFRPHGTFREADMGRPQDFHPFSLWAGAREIYGYCVGSLGGFCFGMYEQFTPELAIKIEERQGPEGPEYWVHLRDGVTWASLNRTLFPANMELASHFFERHPVTAHDFKFYYNAVMNPHVQSPLATVQRQHYSDIESFEVIDDLTFVVRWRAHSVELEDGTVEPRILYSAFSRTVSMSPLASWVYQYFANGAKIIEDPSPDTYRHNSIWAQNFAEHWAKQIVVSCGPWLFDGLTDHEIVLKRNPRHYNQQRVLAQRKVINFKTSPDALWQDFKAGEIDTFNSRDAPEKLPELATFLGSKTYREQPSQIERLDFLERLYSYVGWNENNPLFTSQKVRQALTMAIDRQRVIEQALGGLGIETTGPFFIHDEGYDTAIEPWPYDPLAARRLLEAEGWRDTNGDGLLDKEIDGERREFRFQLLYYVHSQKRRAIADAVSTALREIGIDCQPLGVDTADIAAATEGKDFDALCMAWMLPPPPHDPRQLWHSSGAKQKGSSNFIGFANPEIDAIIERLDYTYDSSERVKLAHRFHQIIHEEAPYLFLYVPKVAFLYRDYVQNVFIPVDRPDLIPHAKASEPLPSGFWLKAD